MKNQGGKITALLTALIVHLLAGIIFMSVKLRMLNEERSGEYEVEYAAEEKEELPLKEQKPPATIMESILGDDREMLNIARNLSNKADPKVNADEYVDDVKDEMIRNGQLGKDNFIEDQKRQKNNPPPVRNEENAVIEEVGSQDNKTAEKKPLNYQGPTRILYSLERRYHLRLPLPIYKCQGSGLVVLSIEVSQKGIVEKAVINNTESTTSDPCLIESAIAAALDSRFNSDLGSPKVQAGVLSYQFVAQ